MNLGAGESLSLAQAYLELSKGTNHTEVWISPAIVNLAALQQLEKHGNFRYGSQNVHWENNGAYTGEVSVPMLRELGADFSLTGHSERRHVFGETNALVVNRTCSAIRLGLTTVLCIGEQLSERERNLTDQVITEQLLPVLEGLKENEFSQLVIAYEPVWAIGTGKVANVAEISAAHAAINNLCSKYTQLNIPILYGGSVSPDNYEEIVKIDHVAGALVGGASLVADKFAKLLQISESA